MIESNLDLFSGNRWKFFILKQEDQVERQRLAISVRNNATMYRKPWLSLHAWWIEADRTGGTGNSTRSIVTESLVESSNEARTLIFPLLRARAPRLCLSHSQVIIRKVIVPLPVGWSITIRILTSLHSINTPLITQTWLQPTLLTFLWCYIKQKITLSVNRNLMDYRRTHM